MSLVAPSTAARATLASMADDPFLWLEEIDSERALSWVREQNAVSTAELTAQPGFEPLRSRLLSVYDSNARIPFVSKLGA
jgi:prolyl oligopeptidase